MFSYDDACLCALCHSLCALQAFYEDPCPDNWIVGIKKSAPWQVKSDFSNAKSCRRLLICVLKRDSLFLGSCLKILINIPVKIAYRVCRIVLCGPKRWLVQKISYFLAVAGLLQSEKLVWIRWQFLLLLLCRVRAASWLYTREAVAFLHILHLDAFILLLLLFTFWFCLAALDSREINLFKSLIIFYGLL